MKKRKILSIIIAVIIALNCFSVFAIATPRTTQYHGISGITRVKQAKSNWCWAACSEMVGKHYNSASGQNQYSIVYHFNNNYDNVTATGAQTAAAATYASAGTIHVEYAAIQSDCCENAKQPTGYSRSFKWVRIRSWCSHIRNTIC